MMLVLKCLSQNQKVLTFCWSVFVVDCLKTRNGAGCRNCFKLSAHDLFALEAFKKLNVFLVTRPLYTVRGGRAGPPCGVRGTVAGPGQVAGAAQCCSAPRGGQISTGQGN